MDSAEVQSILVRISDLTKQVNALLTTRSGRIENIMSELIACCQSANAIIDDITEIFSDLAAEYSATFTDFLCEKNDPTITTTTTTAATTTTTTTRTPTTTTTTTYPPLQVDWTIEFDNYICQQEDDPYVTTLSPRPEAPVFSAEFTNFLCEMADNPSVTTTSTTVGVTTTTTTVPPGDVNFSATYSDYLCEEEYDAYATTTTTTRNPIDEDLVTYELEFDNYICQQEDVTTTTTTQAAITTTTLPVTTTTTTVMQEAGIPKSGTSVFGAVYDVYLGAVKGEVLLIIDSHVAPDKFVVVYDDNIVIDTGYRGSLDFQNSLYAALAAIPAPLESIQDASQTTFSFIKTTPTLFAKVYVYAPLEETEWSFTLSPVVATTTTTILEPVFLAEYSDFLCEETDNGVITTTLPVTTTTTTEAAVPVEIINCGSDTHEGQNAYPYLYIVIGLGTGVGWVNLEYDTNDIPDKFIVEYNGLEVINTGYRGDAELQNDLDNALIGYGDAPEAIQGSGTGVATFYKTGSTQNAIVKVYAPMEESKWSFVLRCPDGSTTTTSTTTTQAVTTTTTTASPTTTTTTTNALPISTDNAISNVRVTCSNAITLVPADFTYTDTDGGELEYIKIIGFTLYGEGTLKYNGIDVVVNQIIPVYGGATGSFLYSLVYTPDASVETQYSDYIQFKVRTKYNSDYR